MSFNIKKITFQISKTLNICRSSDLKTSIRARRFYGLETDKPRPGLESQPDSKPRSSKRDAKWDLLSAVCLLRKPVISTEKSDLEKTYGDLLSQIEFEKSYLSDHEMRHKEDLKQAELLKKGEDADIDQTMKQTAQDFEDSCQEEFQKFKFAPRTSEADQNNTLKSFNRKLDKSLLLFTEQKLGSSYLWVFPQGIRNDGETMRQTADRVLREKCGHEVKVRFMGNSPCGFYKYKYPKHFREIEGNPVGAKVFFFKAEHLAGQIELEPSNGVKDFKWLSHKELGTCVNLPKEYMSSVAQFLIED